MMILIYRHLILFFKDKSAIFFSLMAVFVVVGLYVSFLGEMMIGPLVDRFGNAARELSDNWIIAGTLGCVALTTSMSALGIMMEDQAKHINKDFYVSPIGNFKILFSYLISTFIITLIISLIALLIGELYIVYYGGKWLTVHAFIKLMLMMFIIILSCVCVLLSIMVHFKSTSAFSNITTIVGTLSGFLMGIYVPIGALPSGLQNVIRFFPFSHGASLYRKIMMEDVMKRIFKDVPYSIRNNFKIEFGLDFQYESFKCNTFISIIILSSLVLIFSLYLWTFSKNRHLK
ncbi:MAG: ABC transporter permease [Erysipelotrichaceae bacterium]